MDKIVYKITNNINGKVYVGQTNNLKRRIQEHKHDKRDGHPIYSAIKEFGWENFSTEILYEGPDYDKKEEEYIAQFESYDPQKGYNVLPGRINSCGEINPDAVISNELATKIINDLMTTDLTCGQIAEQYAIREYIVRNINYGKSFRQMNLSYPIRNTTIMKTKKIINNIISDLKNDYMSYDDICNKYQIPKYVLMSINAGKHYRLPNEQYPIRKKYISEKTKNIIIHLLKTTSMTGIEIAKTVGVEKSIVYRINLGKTWYDENISYPIRNLVH